MTSRSRNSSTILHCLVDNEQYFNVPAVIASRSDGCDCKSLNAITWLVRFLLVHLYRLIKPPSPSDEKGARAVFLGEKFNPAEVIEFLHLDLALLVSTEEDSRVKIETTSL